MLSCVLYPIGILFIWGCTMNKPQELWQKKKSDLLAVINETMEQGNVDKDVLEIMKELLNNTKVRNSMEDYFDDLE